MQHSRILVLALLLSGCVTTETTSPDGTVTRIRRQDPKLVKTIVGAATDAAVAAARAEVERRIQEENRR